MDKEMIKTEDLAREIKLLKSYLYLIDYGYGRALLYTPYDPVERFCTLGNTCFGLRKSIAYCHIINKLDVKYDDFERLEFNGDIYVWDRYGRRKNIYPYHEEEWDEWYSPECIYKGE